MKFGFIGCGNMASAIINGGLKKGIFTKEELLASVKTEASARKVQDTLGISCTTDNLAVAAQADYLFLAVKPQFCEEVASQISQSRKEGQILVSIAAGKTLAWLKEKFGKDQKIIRTMPNTPALVGEGITGVCPDDLVTEEEINQVLTILECHPDKACLIKIRLCKIAAVKPGAGHCTVRKTGKSKIAVTKYRIIKTGLPEKRIFKSTFFKSRVR